MNIYVGNLNYKVEEDDLRELFDEYGEVSKVTIIKDKMTGQGKGFGFVEMAEQADAQKAIEELDGSEVMGRNIKVNEAKPMEKKNNNFNRRY